MAEVVTFVNFRPPVRYDGIPWTQAQIEESVASDGVYTLLETKTLTPVDVDPSHPGARSFTTELGTDINYWYRITFVDGTGDTSQPTTPIQNVPGSVAAPTATAYATVEELAQILNLTPKLAVYRDALNRTLEAAAFEINEYLDTSYTTPPALVVQVNLERAVEHWSQMQAPFGIIGMGGVEGGASYTGWKDTWTRHADKLSYLQTSWGIA